MKKFNKPTGDIRLEGTAEKDGVAFKVSKFIDNDEVPFSGTIATVDEDGKITCNMLKRKIDQPLIDYKIHDYGRRVFLVAGLSSVLVSLGMLLSVFINHKTLYYASIYLFFLSGIAIVFQFSIGILIAKICGDKDIKSFSKFLAAKNAVENAYYDLGRMPTLEESKRYSKISSNSKYVVWPAMPFICILVILSKFIPKPINIVASIIILIAIIVLQKLKAFRFWQYLIISKPEQIHYMTAIKALNETVMLPEMMTETISFLRTNLQPVESLGKECIIYDLSEEEKK